MMKTSKYKNIFCEPKKERYTNLNPSSSATEGSNIEVNANFLAVSVEGMGANILILDPTAPSYLSPNLPVIDAGRVKLTDMKFSPFRSDLLATGLDDGTIKLFQIPQGGLKEKLNKEIQQYLGHTKRVSNIKFNPCAADVVSSGSSDGAIHCWNMIKSEAVNVANFKSATTSLDWNYNGSLIGSTLKNRHLVVYDPRANKTVIDTETHSNNRSSKMVWVDQNTLLSVGFSGSKEFKYYDIRKANNLVIPEPLQCQTIDHSTCICTPYLDMETKLVYLNSRGEGNIFLYELDTDGLFKQINCFGSPEQVVSLAMFERKFLDYNKNEIDRFYKVSGKNIITLPFVVPRRSGGYDETLYPPVYCGETVSTFDEWKGGADKEPAFKKINTIENKWVSKVEEFVKKEKEVIPTDITEKTKYYEKKVATLEENLKKEEAKNEQLKTELDGINKKISEAEEKLKAKEGGAPAA